MSELIQMSNTRFYSGPVGVFYDSRRDIIFELSGRRVEWECGEFRYMRYNLNIGLGLIVGIIIEDFSDYPWVVRLGEV